MIKLRFALFIVLCIAFSTKAQTIVNAYAKVSSVTGSSVLAVSDVNIANHTFTVGGQVIVMQVQDNVIGTNTTNANSFGNLSSIANAGIYEIRTIAAVSPTSGAPTSITLSAALANTFNTGANSAVQIITFRDLGANYTTTANITGLGWTGKVGGVVAFYVTNTLTLNHQVFASKLGFRGGAVSANAGSDLTCVNTSYISNSTTLGRKGEGIYAATTTSFTIARGKILNGGGGGSENNAGGGGGGNYTAGGSGGLGYPCTTANSGRGIGGLSLSGQISVSRIFFGGGGGGGQANNSVATPGGNGGGIVLIKAGTIATSTTCGAPVSIAADGDQANNSGNDGAGGGGAGGSIVIQATSFSITPTCTLEVRSNGGSGGSVSNGAAHGGGGGGGQGVVFYSSAQPTANVATRTNNGAAGTDDSGGTTNAGSGAGTNGSGIAAGVSGPLPIELVYFMSKRIDNKVKLSWQTATEKNNKLFVIERSEDGESFYSIGSVRGKGNSGRTSNYELYDNNPQSGINYYRLKQIDTDESFSYSPLAVESIENEVDFSMYPNPMGIDDLLTIVSEKNTSSITKQISILDMSGKEIFKTELNSDNNKFETKLNTSELHLESGIYIVRVECGTKSVHKKLVVK